MCGRNLENQQRAAAALTTTGSCPLCSNAPHEHQDNADEEEYYHEAKTKTKTMTKTLCSNAPYEYQDNADEEEDYEDSFTQCYYFPAVIP